MPGHVNIGGTWKTVSGISANVSGTWKTVQSGHVNVSGTWKQFYQNTIPATFLVVNPGQSRFQVSSANRVVLTGSCQSQRSTSYSGAAAGRYGTGSINLSPGTSYSVVVGTSSNGTSTFNSLAWNGSGMTQGTGYSNGGGASASYSCCDYYCQQGYGYPQTGSWPVYGGGAGTGGPGGSANSSQYGSGGPRLQLTSWNNIYVGAGSGGFNSSNWASSGSSGTAGNYGNGEGLSATGGAVVIKYADSLPLPVSGTYSAATAGGFRFLTCTSSTTLVW